MAQVTTDEHDPLVAEGAHGVLGRFNRAGVLTAADVHVAQRLGRLGGETDDQVLLAVALTVRAVRSGSVCLDLAGAGADLLGAAGPADEPTGASPDVAAAATVSEVLVGSLPEPGDWWAALERSPLLGTALQREAGLLYLDRYWREESEVVRVLGARASATPPAVDDAALVRALAAAFPEAGSDDQRRAAETALRSWTSVITGGPGTGKTTTVARLLGVLEDLAATEGRPLRVALAAPTGKAAARMTEAVRSAAAGPAAGLPATAEAGSTVSRLEATTLHRLLGWRPDSRTRFRHDRSNPLPHDVVVVDETSMLSLTLTARLLEAVRPSARLVLVGDADQLASVEAGAVLTDLVEGYAAEDLPSAPALHARPSPVARLVRSRRFGEGIGSLADAVRSGEEDAVLAALSAGGPVTWLRTGDGGDDAPSGDDLGRVEHALADHAVALHEAAEAADTTAALRQLDRHRLLCAHRAGPFGVAYWNRRVERLLQERIGRDWLPEWYAGRPLVVNGNDHGLQLFNGDTAVVCRAADGGLAAVISSGPQGSRVMATTRLPDVSTAHAMTVHRSQGSQFEAVTLLLPEPSSRILTRELLYTAVTRATTQVTVVGSEAAVRAAVSRRARRATGLGQRLRIGSAG